MNKPVQEPLSTGRMSELERLAAIEAIRQVKARYFRGVDTDDAELVRGILAEDCVLDYTGCFLDPKTGTDYFAQMSIVVRGREGWPKRGLPSMGIVTIHQGHHADIEITGETTASGIWAMTDHIFMPPGAPYARITGYGHYHETYEKIGGAWQIKTLRISRLRVEAA
jgi:hypothetical protein